MEKLKVKSKTGYLWLTQFLNESGIKVYPYYRESYLLEEGNNRIVQDLSVIRYYYKKKKVEDNLWGNIEFALKHEGLNLELFKQLFNFLSEEEVKKYVTRKPRGKYNRIVWFLYEWLTDNRLDIPDTDTRIYVNLLDEEKYYTCEPIKHKRYSIKENLLGNKNFCPFVRKNEVINRYSELDLKEKANKILENYDSSLIKRASSYLYFKETRSSSDIERERPNQARLVRFINILEQINQLNELSKSLLIGVQNVIVDSRYMQKDYRSQQNYVGESLSYDYQKIHYIPPKPEDVELLMNGLIECYERMLSSNLPPIIIAAAISFGFVFIHPFEDGNGRIHRFLIHYTLAKTNFTSDNIIFPISSTILNNIKQYDECLESYSKPLVSLIDYEMDDDNRMTVLNDSQIYYQYIDMTAMTEYLYKCLIDTLDTSFKEELDFLVSYDKIKEEIQDIVDMPDSKITLFIKLCKQNNGKLSSGKRNAHFSELTEGEVVMFEKIYEKNMNSIQE